MAIRTVKSSVFGSTDANGRFTPDLGSSALGQLMRISGTVTNLASDNQGSVYHLCDLPVSCILLPETRIKVTGWGFAQAVVGVAGYTDQLLDVAVSGAAANGNAPITIFGAKWNKPIWQQLGMPAAPQNFVTLAVFTEGDATADGQIDFSISTANHI